MAEGTGVSIEDYTMEQLEGEVAKRKLAARTLSSTTKTHKVESTYYGGSTVSLNHQFLDASETFLGSFDKEAIKVWARAL